MDNIQNIRHGYCNTKLSHRLKSELIQKQLWTS